ncbi:hypothetical protein [Deinococcus arenicola]|uniref:Uncharacterized protein n=1 Tax=Deinococcus arenicola TaxID=2994950 RepID=A0ABU4DUI0_9DEIO|nr:hypothetical protein [Deinococcus sp. ZS9-10]MDV6375349.1 hypothetical protein [Deinococcus sp. ZS9-10]
MTGHTSNEHFDELPENHSDAESLRNIPKRYEKNPGVVQDGPGNPDVGLEQTDEPDELPGRVSI